MYPIVKRYEHQIIRIFNKCVDKDKIFEEFNKNTDSKRYLGVEQSFNFKKKLELKASYYIGYRWFKENESYIHISQKEHQGKKADFMAMFLECLKDPIVSKTIMKDPDKLYKIFFDEPLIEIKDAKDNITPFLILHFLQLVKNITRKGLKKGYIKVTENLTSKIKGKILINQTIKQNHLKNRLDKTVCNHQIFTINCIENQIIKTALMKCGRHLHGIQDDNISKMLRQNISAFELVDEKEIFDSDFSKIKYSPFYKEYKEALNLAKMIFKRFGFALNNATLNTTTNKIPPYYINMPELFERYVEVKLRQSNYDVMDGNNNGKIAHWQMRPDFLLPSKKMIIDAKYKFWYENGKTSKEGRFQGEDANFKDDYMQLSLYGRDKIIREKIGLENSNEEADLLFIYPKLVDTDTLDNMIELDNISDFFYAENKYKFNNIRKIVLKIPISKVDKK